MSLVLKVATSKATTSMGYNPNKGEESVRGGEGASLKPKKKRRHRVSSSAKETYQKKASCILAPKASKVILEVGKGSGYAIVSSFLKGSRGSSGRYA